MLCTSLQLTDLAPEASAWQQLDVWQHGCACSWAPHQTRPRAGGPLGPGADGKRRACSTQLRANAGDASWRSV